MLSLCRGFPQRLIAKLFAKVSISGARKCHFWYVRPCRAMFVATIVCLLDSSNHLVDGHLSNRNRSLADEVCGVKLFFNLEKIVTALNFEHSR